MNPSCKIYLAIFAAFRPFFFAPSLYASCNYQCYRPANPIIEDHAKTKDRVTTLSTIPSRRVVLIDIINKESTKNSEKVYIRSETSPDVIDDFRSTLATALVQGNIRSANLALALQER